MRKDRVDTAIEHRAERSASVLVHALQVLGRQLDWRQGVLDIVRDLARHVGPRRETVRAFEFAALAFQVRRHLVERFDQPAQFVGVAIWMRASRSPRAIRRDARVSRFTGSAMRSAVK